MTTEPSPSLPSRPKPKLNPAFRAPLIAIGFGAAGALVGALVGLIIFEPRYSNTDSAGIGLFGGLAVGTLSGFVIGCFVAGWLGTRASNMSGSVRFLAGAWLPLGMAAGAIVHMNAAKNGYPLLGLLVGGAVAGVLLFGQLRSAPRDPRAIWVGLGVSVILVALGVGAGAVNQNRAFANRLEESGIPLVIVDEQRLQRVLPGWQVQEYSRVVASPLIRSVSVYVTTHTGFELELEADAQVTVCSMASACSDRDPIAAGRVVWGFNPGCRDELTRVGEVVVPRPGGSWTLQFANGRCGDPQGQPTITELDAFVTTLDAATPAEWVEAG